MYEGMSYIQPYYNKACTEPLEESGGSYIYQGDIISSNVINPYRLVVWLKNEGSHTAYDVEITDISSNLTPTNKFIKQDIVTTQVKQCVIEVTVPQGYIGNVTLNFKLNYDSI